MRSTLKTLRSLGLVGLLIAGVACTPLSPNFAQRTAQPKVPAARNFTSFSASLRCMDTLLASTKRGRTLISSTGIPDLTNKISVAGDDMLVNALNQMNRTSGAYVFVDQSLERDSGQIAIYTPQKNIATPTLYVRGSISQVDSSVSSSSGSITSTDQSGERSLGDANANIGRGLSIVTVDMHLVSFPDKTVVPGSSVANSMVVTSRSFGTGATGTINMALFKSTIQISRIESMSQAVRNLVELGAIELIGRHANVPYWECLNIPATKQRQTNRKEIVFSSADKPLRIPEVQKMLTQLGYYSGAVTAVLDQRTRDAISHFQAKSGLIATGDLNYDTYQHLQEQTSGFAPRRRTSDPDGKFQNPEMPTLVIAETTPRPATSQSNPIFKSKNIPRTGPGGLPMRFLKTRYATNDVIRAQISIPSSGFLSCFHRSGTSPIVQVFPMDPNVAFAVSKGQLITVPDAQDGFDIKVESKTATEKLFCIVERNRTPIDISDISGTGPLQPLTVNSFQEILGKMQSKNRRVLWAEAHVGSR
ncbi:hypothetical protein GCM10007939_16610 [Amylibacter marinus]|uniref:Peptidoglycan binding-like domain-containing protein n=1 Tax=Amylibacter marinus TaxID=1475483 RepID=A0ABQ5VVB7_9RHOB|nr:peptidoglycan-binding protein [Amylibacter marinus]GLQ35378.1 hypothetical protein GCM10007939_16610 [Amylibacter marinus]